MSSDSESGGSDSWSSRSDSILSDTVYYLHESLIPIKAIISEQAGLKDEKNKQLLVEMCKVYLYQVKIIKIVGRLSGSEEGFAEYVQRILNENLKSSTHMSHQTRTNRARNKKNILPQK